MVKLHLSEAERSIIDIFDPRKSECSLPETLPVDFIVDNRLCYSLYNKVGAELETKYDSEALERIRRKAKSMEFSVNELRNVAKAFEENGINFVFIFKAITTQCDSKDVDTAIGDTQFKQAEEILESLGYYAPISLYNNHFVKSKGSDETIQIHLHTERDYKRSLYILGEEKVKILGNRRKMDDLYVLSPEDDLVTSIFNTIMKRHIPIGNLLHIAYALENCRDIDYLKKCVKKEWFTPLFHYIYVINIIYKNLFGKDIDSPLIPIAEKMHKKSKILGFLAKIETKKIKIPFRSRILLFYWYIHKVLNIRHLHFKEEMTRTMSHYFPIYHYTKLVLSARKKNMLVSFSGIDGTGKTTHINKLVNRFKDMMIPAQYARGLWSPKISYPLMGVIYLLKGWRRKDYHKSRILRKIWNYIVILDFIYIYLFKIKIHLLVGKTVFCDRYVYDLMATLMHDGLYNERASKIMLKLFPQPDLAFMLDIPPEVSDLRKDDTQESLDGWRMEEDALEYLKVMRENFMNISKSLNIPIIDTTKELNDIHEKLFNKVLETYKNKGVNKK